MRRLIWTLSALLLIVGVIDTPRAAAQQSVNLYIGGFTPRSEDARGTNDVIFGNGSFLSSVDTGLPVESKDFRSATFGAEWLVGLGDLFDAGLGIGFSQKTVPVFHTGLTHDNGDEILQDLKLRIIPFTATVRFLPLGHHAAIRPYIGGGVGVLSWRYSETGEFVDATDKSIFRDSFSVTGSNAAPVVLGGVTVPIASAGIGGEIRWQGGKGRLPADGGFAGTKIDLGGMSYLFMVNFRF